MSHFSGQQHIYIQFYSIALMQPAFYSQCSAFKNLQESDKSCDQTRFSLEHMLIAAINEQFRLTEQLMENQKRLSQELKKEKQSSDSGQSSLANNQKLTHRLSADEEQDFKFASDKIDDSSSNKSPKEQEPLSRLRIRKVFKYQVDSNSQENKRQIKRCQTKNIIKNFIKSIFNFIRKHRTYIQRVLKQNNIKQDDFMQILQQLNGKVNTILQLRQLWTQKPYSNVFRTISSHFLRRYSLKHIFHSRISNHQVHLKYRQKLLQSIEKPEQFTSLKDF